MLFYISIDDTCFKFHSKKEFLEEIAAQIDDCERNGGAEYSISVEADAYCFNKELLNEE